MTSLVTAKYDSAKNQILDPNTNIGFAQLATDPLTGVVGGYTDPATGAPVNWLTPLLRKPVLKVSWIGNSLVANGSRMMSRLQVLSGGRLVTVKNAGHVGVGMASVISTMAVDIDPTADIVIVNEGSNDATINVGTGSTNKTGEYDYMVAFATYVKSLGKLPIICASPPRGAVGGATSSATRLTNRYPFSDQLAALDTGALFTDPWYDFRDTNGTYLPGYSDDNTHPSNGRQDLYDLAASRIWNDISPFLAGQRTPYMEVISDMDNAGYSGSDSTASGITLGNALFQNGTTGWVNSNGARVALSTASAAPFRGNKMVLNFATPGISGADGTITVLRSFLNTGSPTKPSIGDTVMARLVVDCTQMYNAIVRITVKSPSNFSETSIREAVAPFSAEMFSATAVWAANPNADTQIIISISKLNNLTFTATGSGTNLTVSAVSSPPNNGIQIGSTLSGTGIPAGTTIVSQTSGTPGGAGVYVTSAATTASAASVEVLGTGIISVSNVDLYNLTKQRTTQYGY